MFSLPTRLIALAAVLVVSPLFADEESDESRREMGRVIVISERAFVQLQDAEPKPIKGGTVFSYSIVNDDWVWSDKHWGWVKRENLVEFEDAIGFFTKEIQKAAASEADDAQMKQAVAYHYRGIVKSSMENPTAALEDFRKAQELGMKTPGLAMNFAKAFRALGKFEDAIKAATDAIRLDPDSSLAYHVRAGVLFEQDQLEASLVDAEQAIALDDQNADAYNNRGITLRMLGRYKKAAEDYTAALKIAPRHPEALANRGFVLKKLGRYEDAIRDYERAIKVNPKEAVVYNDLAWLLATCPDEEFRDAPRAVELAKKAVKLDPRDGQFLDTLAAAYAADGDFESAAETGMKAVRKLSDADQYEADQRVALYVEGKPYVEKPVQK